MNGHATILRANGVREEIPLDSVPDLALLQKWVGGYVEVVPRFQKFENKRCVAFCNETGKLDGLQRNEAATRLWAALVNIPLESMPDVLVGDIAIVTGSQSFLNEL